MWEAADLVRTTERMESQQTVFIDRSVSAQVGIFLIGLIFRKQIIMFQMNPVCF